MPEITLTPTTARNIRTLADARGKALSEKHLEPRSLTRMLLNEPPLAQMTSRDSKLNMNCDPHFALTPLGWSIARALPADLPDHKFRVKFTLPRSRRYVQAS